MSADKPRLGRGLDALLSRAPVARQESVPRSAQPVERTDGLKRLPIAQIRPNPMQPRKEFREEDLADLEASLRVSGLLQPVTVRPAPSGNGYELIAGERRFRASQRLGWTEIPAIVKEIGDKELLTLALVENLQRADLNPIEEAEGYQALMGTFSLTQQETADIVGKDRSTVANMLRLLGLPVSVRKQVRDGAISLGHARALLSLGDEMRIADLAATVVSEGLSVREVERRVREAVAAKTGTAPSTRKSGSTSTATTTTRPAEVRLYEEQLRRRFQTDAKLILTGKEQGEIRLSFYNNEDLSRLLELMLGAPGGGLA